MKRIIVILILILIVLSTCCSYRYLHRPFSEFTEATDLIGKNTIYCLEQLPMAWATTEAAARHLEGLSSTKEFVEMARSPFWKRPTAWATTEAASRHLKGLSPTEKSVEMARRAFWKSFCPTFFKKLVAEGKFERVCSQQVRFKNGG